MENATANLAMFGDEIVSVELPASVELDDRRDRARRAGRPGVGRPQAGHAARPARSSQVPLFVNPGDRVKVDTRSGEYITRV